MARSGMGDNTMLKNEIKKKLIWPDYRNCIANLPNSILKKFGVETVGDTLPLLDRYLTKDYKNIVVILLDGMGKTIIESHLKEDGPFRSHLAGIYNSVFLSTTVAATTSVMSGLQPCEHSWLGWECYYPSVDKNITVFFNYLQGTEEQAAPYNVPWTVTHYENVFEKINKSGKKAFMLAPFMPPNPKNTGELCDEIKNKCNEPGQKYVYAYWNQPDGLMHRNGCKADVVHEAMLAMEEDIRRLADELNDTLIVVTADHGHIDNEFAVLQDYPRLCDCLVRLPSLEPRVLNLFVKEDKRDFFENEFNRLFADNFLLMPMEEVIAKNLFGTGKHHEQFRGMLGDYLAIATGSLSIFFNEERWLSMHGSLTEDEMQIPLIVFESSGH